MKRDPAHYVALLRTPGGLLQKASIYADTISQAYHTVRELWPGLAIVRMVKEGDW